MAWNKYFELRWGYTAPDTYTTTRRFHMQMGGDHLGHRPRRHGPERGLWQVVPRVGGRGKRCVGVEAGGGQSGAEIVPRPLKVPPALLLRNPSGVISSPCSLPSCSTLANPAPISTPFTALIPIMAPAMSESSRP